MSRDRIDIYWIHRANNIQKWTSELISLIIEKQIRIVGVSNHSLQQIKKVKDILEKSGLELGVVQNHYSIIYKEAENNGIFQYFINENILFFSYMVLEQGALTGVYTKGNTLPKNSRRGKAFTPDILDRLLAIL